jgi:hypothetical protein
MFARATDVRGERSHRYATHASLYLFTYQVIEKLLEINSIIVIHITTTPKPVEKYIL